MYIECPAGLEIKRSLSVFDEAFVTDKPFQLALLTDREL